MPRALVLLIAALLTLLQAARASAAPESTPASLQAATTPQAALSLQAATTPQGALSLKAAPPPRRDYLPHVRAARAAAARASTRLGEVGGPQAQAPHQAFITLKSERRGPTGGGSPGNVRHVHAGLDPANPTFKGDLGGYSYSAFGKTLGLSDPGFVAPPDSLITQPFRWQGKRLFGSNLYDSRARVWSADLGTFLQPDEYGFLSRGGTLWSWPGQNPYRWRDPSGREPAEDLAGEIIDRLLEFSPVPGGAANDNAIAAEEAGGGLSPIGAALLAAGALGAFADQVQGLGRELFAQQDANANAIARAAARARPAAGGAGEPPDGPECGPRRPRHHIFPQAFRAQFEAAGIDIDDYTIEMSSEGHAGLHGPGEWNGNWDEFLNAGPERSAQEIVDHATQMLNDYGLQNEPIVPYN